MTKMCQTKRQADALIGSAQPNTSALHHVLCHGVQGFCPDGALTSRKHQCFFIWNVALIQADEVRMARWLDKQIPEGIRILCSPAVRAEQTVAALGRKYKVRDELSPQGNHDHLLELVQWPHGKHAVLVVGHQPFLGRTAAKLLQLPEEDLAIRKGAVWWFRTRVREGETQTVLLSVQSPEML